MSFELRGSVGYDEIDKLMGKLNAALRNRNLTAVAGRRAYKQVKEKYPKRWKEQTRGGSIYQRTKKEAAAFGGTGFPDNNAEPGFLTGATFRGIHLQNSELGSTVAPAGIWPGKDQPSFEAGVPGGGGDEQGGGLVKNGQSSWFCGNNSGVEFYINGGWAKRAHTFDMPTYLDSGSPLSEPAEKVDWLFLDAEDKQLIERDVSSYLSGMITGNLSALKAMFEAQEYRKKKSKSVEQIETQLEAESIAGVTEAPEIETEQLSGMVLVEIGKIQKRITSGQISKLAGNAQIEQLKAWKG